MLTLDAVALSIILSVLYAVSGLMDAMNNGEKVDWVLFAKTILLSLVAAGIIDSTSMGLLLQMFGTTVVTTVLDKLFNAIIRIYRPPVVVSKPVVRAP